MNYEALAADAANIAINIGLKVLGALVAWIVGRWLIGLVVRMINAALTRNQIDATLQRYMGSIVSVALTVVLVVAILGYFGLETTSFAALLAAAGIAIGAAWSGLLANFAAGAFLIILRPFKVGDFVAAGGVEGTVEQIGLFGTTINTGDNVRTIVGNNKIFGDTIRNYSANPHRRVDRLAQLAHAVDPRDATARLKAALAKIPNVLATPAPEVEIIDFTAMGPVLAVRPYCHNNHYWQVYFDTNRVIAETFGAAGYRCPSSATVSYRHEVHDMKSLAEFSKTTLIGGLLIVLPIYVSVLLLAKTAAGLVAFLQPVTAQIPANVEFRQLIAILIVFVVCFVAGLIVRTRLTYRSGKW